MVQVAIALAILRWRELWELQVKATLPCPGNLEGLGGWTQQRKETQGCTQIF